MDIQYSLSDGDHIKCNQLDTLSVQGRIDILSLAVLVLILLWICIIDCLGESSYGGIIACLWIIGYIIGICYKIYIKIPMQVKRYNENHETTNKHINIELMDTGFMFSNNNDNIIIKLENLVKWREDNDYILVYVDPRQFHAIPKRISELGFDIEWCRRLLLEQLGDPI